MKTTAQRHVCINALFILRFMDITKQTNVLKIVHPALLVITIQDYAFSYVFSMNFSTVR
jgi:hypothetical protein